MSAHTPEPWWHDKHGVRDRGGYICALNWPQRYPEQEERYTTEMEQRTGDACLIAAAPDLLAALRECRSCMDSLRDFVAEGGSRNMIGAITAIAESDALMLKHGITIAKATGEA